MSNGRYVPPYNLAMIHAGLGEHAEAVRQPPSGRGIAKQPLTELLPVHRAP
jgi:hypothetical protein